MNTYTPTIGIEVHAELNTKSKMFCGCTNNPHEAEANTYVCPVCMAHPGTLPTVNKEAVKKLLLVGKAIDGELASYSEFDRKNYFYPDIPKAYQISQYAFPFVKGGELSGVTITRIHLEEDTARSQHDQGEGSLVDFNRAGVPLMELVTEPVIHDAESAGKFVRELQLLLRTLGVTEANMEKGEMRVEANISVSPDETMSKKYVEVKNLNSFKSMVAAIQYEIKRQTKVYEEGGEVAQETRGWDENKDKTFVQRTKETAEDYRYFPDPDIPKFNVDSVDAFSDSRLSEIMPVLPNEKRLKYSNLGLSIEQTEIIISDTEINTFFSSVVDALGSDLSSVKLAANYVTTDIAAILDSSDLTFADASSEDFVSLICMVKDNTINSRVAKDLLSEVVFEHKDPKKLATERGLIQNSSEEGLLPIVDKVVAENVVAVAEYREGKESVLQFLLGQVMKETKGTANPTVALDLLKKRIGQ